MLLRYSERTALYMDDQEAVNLLTLTKVQMSFLPVHTQALLEVTACILVEGSPHCNRPQLPPPIMPQAHKRPYTRLLEDTHSKALTSM